MRLDINVKTFTYSVTVNAPNLTKEEADEVARKAVENMDKKW